MSRQRKSRLYWRNQGAQPRAWADFRDYCDVGGKLEPLLAPGDHFATTDADVAQLLLAARLKELDSLRRGGGLLRPPVAAPTLGDFAARHLVSKAEAARTTIAWLSAMQRHLEAATGFLGAGRPLTGVTPADLRRWIAALRATPNGNGGTLSDGSVRHHLNSLSNVYRGAQEAQAVPPGFNPVSALLDKPTGRRHEAHWLEVPDAAYLLEAARQYAPRRPDLWCPWLYPLVGTYLLTGARLREVLGLTMADVHFERKTVTFRPNAFRPRLKTEGSARVVPLWPQLEAILRAHLNARTAGEVLEGKPARSLLFPGGRTDREGCLDTLPRKAFEALLKRVGMAGQGLSAKTFRHTYCAARLQTTDQGAPVSPYTVSRELGHGSRDMVERVYSHLGEFRCRSEVVEYKVEAFPQLGERLAEHGFVTPMVTVWHVS